VAKNVHRNISDLLRSYRGPEARRQERKGHEKGDPGIAGTDERGAGWSDEGRYAGKRRHGQIQIRQRPGIRGGVELRERKGER